MDYLRNAAIIILGMGENCATEVLKGMSQKEVERLIEVMDSMDDVSEYEIISALNEFFAEANQTTGINLNSKEYIRKTFLNAVGTDKVSHLFEEGDDSAELIGIGLLKWQPMHIIISVLEEEHPQLVTIALMYLASEKAANILANLPKTLANEVINRMTALSPVSSVAMTLLSDYLVEQFSNTEKFNKIDSDGIDTAANILSFMDEASEQDVLSFLTEENKDACERIQEKLFPFERLTTMDTKNFQLFLAEVSNEDLMLALKGADDRIQKIFFKNMSSKSAALLQEDMESMGMKKPSDFIEAQKRLVEAAKKMIAEQKIMLPTQGKRHSKEVVK